MTVTVVKWYIMEKRRVKMEKIVLDGETFYFEKGKLYDSSFIETPSATWGITNLPLNAQKGRMPCRAEVRTTRPNFPTFTTE